MTLSGPDALRSLDEALRDIRREEDEIAKRLARSAELVTKFKETESELFRQLAQVRLDPATQKELSTQLTQAELKARQMLAQHSSDLTAAENQLKALDGKIAALGAERAEQVAAAGKAQLELRTLADTVSGTISTSPDYMTKKQAADALASVAGESLSKTQQAEADRDQKGRPYRDDPLFMYLWERGYGTKNYRENNLISYLDSLIAQMVGFPEARVNFAMLNEIPMRLREHAERQQQIAQAAADALRAAETAALDAAGGKPVRLVMEKAESRVAAIDEETVTLEDQRDTLARQQRQLAQGSSPEFASAINGLAEVLGREDIKTLLAAARATHTGQDDTIVQQIDDQRQRAAEEEADTRDQKARLKTLAARRRELEDIQYEFKKQGFDNPRSSFGEDKLVGTLLNDFLRGGITAADYWMRWRQSQNWSGGGVSQGGPWGGNSGNGGRSQGGFNWPDSSFGGGSSGGKSGGNAGGFGGSWGKLPGAGGGGFGGGNSGGGGFSRPRSGSSGNRTSGGFKTGGGF